LIVHDAQCVTASVLLRLRLLLLLLASNYTLWLVQLPAWSSCGAAYVYTGVVSKPDTSKCCPLETSCRKYNEHFWQCIPDGVEPQPEAVVDYPATCTGTKVRTCLATGTLVYCVHCH
jgi:hypothetical protein